MIIKIGKTRAKGEEYDVYMLVGKATGDAETKQSKAGKAFSKVSVAAQQNPDSTTMFVTVMGFGGLNATIGSIKKGGSVFAIGKLEKNEYNGKTYWSLTPEYAASAGGFFSGSFKPIAKANNPIVEITETEETLPF